MAHAAAQLKLLIEVYRERKKNLIDVYRSKLGSSENYYFFAKFSLLSR